MKVGLGTGWVWNNVMALFLAYIGDLTYAEIFGCQLTYALVVGCGIVWLTRRHQLYKDHDEKLSHANDCCKACCTLCGSKAQSCWVRCIDALWGVFINALSFVFAWGCANTCTQRLCVQTVPKLLFSHQLQLPEQHRMDAAAVTRATSHGRCYCSLCAFKCLSG